MSNWKCGKCGKVYSSDEFASLTYEKMVEDDPDPKQNYGYGAVCPCGYRFHKDKWHTSDDINRFPKKYQVSSVFLELDHGYGDEHIWYETMIFHYQRWWSRLRRRLSWSLMRWHWRKKNHPLPKMTKSLKHWPWSGVETWRYETQAEAEENHRRVVKALSKDGIRAVEALE